MRSGLSSTLLAAALAVAIPTAATAQQPGEPGLVPTTAVQPFKLGTFNIDGEDRLGIVLEDRLVVDLERANRQLERNPAYVPVPMPADMKELIGRYQYGLKGRLYEIVNDLVANDRLATARPAFVYDLNQVETEAPIKNPTKILNAAVNYYGHVNEGDPEGQAAERERRRRERGVPYLFHKSTVGAIIGQGDPIVIHAGRDRVDWEVELGVVIGRPARYVSATDAADYIFGYTIHLDMSDRGGRPPGGYPNPSDWFVGKGNEGHAPLGPFIVPAEFYGDPMNKKQRLTVDGDVRQDHTSADMIHNIYELIEYGSSIITLFPGDIIAGGSGAGVGSGTAVRGFQLFLKPGETLVATIEGIGTLTHPIVAGKAPATPSTGSRIPAVSSYRQSD